MRIQKVDEKHIVNKALNGDAAAFGELYQRYLDPIYNYVFYRVNHREEAEDLTEAVFFKAWQALSENPPREIPFRIWLYRIAHNAVVDHYRTRKDQVGLEAISELRDPIAGPESTIAGWERSVALKTAIQQLKEEHQQVIICRFIIGLCHADTAMVMKRSEEATRALQYRAIVALKNILIIQEGPYV